MARGAREVNAQKHVRARCPSDRLSASNGDVELLGVLQMVLVQFENLAFNKMALGGRRLALIAAAR
jgi:hypothetical protein